MNPKTLKAAVSSVIYTAETDIQKLNEFNPCSVEENTPENIRNLANMAGHISTSFAAVEDILNMHALMIAGIDKKKYQELVSGVQNMVRRISDAISAKPDLAEDLAQEDSDNDSEDA